MRIAVIAPLSERVPPTKYGGTERVIYYLVEGLVKRGHEVTLFASGDSKTSGKLFSVVPKCLRELNEPDMYGTNYYSLMNIGLAYSRQAEFDVIHDHNPHLSMPAANICQTAVVLTWHGPFNKDITRYLSVLNNHNLVSISKSQAGLAPELSFAGNVYNGLTMEDYPFSENPKDYLLFVGRIDREKGVHISMDAAVRLNKKLIIAAKLDDNVWFIKKYYEDEIKPRLERHPDLLQWIGEVAEPQRNELMKDAHCFLHAVTWPEPFGLTLIEAMACGAPVVGFRNGSIPELVKDGLTGFVVDDIEGMIEAVKKIDTIDRAACRKHALQFSAARMAEGYEAIYQQAIDKKKGFANRIEH